MRKPQKREFHADSDSISPETETPAWPTLEGRLKNALTSREEAILQLQITMPLSPLARAVLDKKKPNSSKHRIIIAP